MTPTNGGRTQLPLKCSEGPAVARNVSCISCVQGENETVGFYMNEQETPE